MDDVLSISYIYGLVDPRDKLLYYIGQSTDVIKRYFSHLSDARQDNPKVIWINDLKINGLVPLPVIFAERENVTVEYMNKLESLYIQAACDLCMPLCCGETYTDEKYYYVSPYTGVREKNRGDNLDRVRARIASHLLPILALMHLEQLLEELEEMKLHSS